MFFLKCALYLDLLGCAGSVDWEISVDSSVDRFDRSNLYYSFERSCPSDSKNKDRCAYVAKVAPQGVPNALIIRALSGQQVKIRAYVRKCVFT